MAKLLVEFILEKEAADFMQPLDYILKNDVARESIKGKYAGNTVFFIRSAESAADILKSIYYNCDVNIVEDSNGVYLVKEVEDPELEAASIIDGISEEKGIKVIIGSGRMIGGSYTVRDSAAHANSAVTLAINLGKSEGFYHIDKMLIYGMLFSLDEKTIDYYMNGGYEGFIDAARDKELLSTAEELFKCDLNISEAARKLYLHRNTLLYRIEKIKNHTGLDIKKFEEAVIFRTITAVYKFKGR
jgi:sugar diacid utilization regulator